jgi:hypothetical protein
VKTKTQARRAEKPKSSGFEAPKAVVEAEKDTKTPPETAENMNLRPENTPEDGRVAISWYADQEGKPDISRMRPAMRERLKGLIADPEVVKALGVEAAPVPQAEAVKVFDPAYCSSLYGAVGFIEALFAQKFLELNPEMAKQIFTYSPAEIEKLSDPTSKVLNKYAADWMIRFKDEIALGMLFFSITAGKIMAARMLTMKPTQAATAPNGKEKGPASAPSTIEETRAA